MEATVHTLRTIARTPWGYMGYAEFVIDDLDPISLEEAKKRNLRAVQERLTPPTISSMVKPPTPVADTTIAVAETLVTQNPLTSEKEDVLERFEEYEIPFWKMSA